MRKRLLISFLVILVVLSSVYASISSDEALNIALKEAGIEKSQASKIKSKTDREDGWKVYEIKFTSGEYKYDVDIDQESGDIISFDYELRKKPSSNKNASIMGIEEAKAIASKLVPSITNARVKREYDDGLYIYEIETYENGREYDIELDAVTGKILSFSNDLSY